ncbi:protein SDA1 homolog [Phalaenopsis equestris]|uniref:protein SDA1 homolog n=1 Tax=Phalaenopsis equestris TaxID=78828 RepID=UPI0009E5ACCA|nr:protein SDA1 homolog [Phalaenopsis equestris]
MAATNVTHLLAPDSLSASGKAAERLSLPLLQSRMKLDPEGYEEEMLLIYRHFKSTLNLFRQQSALSPSSDPVLAKDLGDLVLFLAHMTPFYPLRLAEFPNQVSELLKTDARALPSSLRCHLARSLILLVNRKIVEFEGSLELFMDLQVIGDRTLRKLTFSHVVHSIRHMNTKHRNEAQDRKLHNILFKQLQGDEELRARRSLAVLCDLYRRKVWFDARTANAICNACFHSSSRVMVAALSFLLGFENNEGNFDDSDASSSDDDETSQNPQVFLSREDVYKAKHKGTASSKRKKKAKLQRVIRSIKRQHRKSSEKSGPNSYSPLTHLNDAQGFAEKLFSRLHTCNEKFEVRMMMLKVIARTIGLHFLILLNFYPFLQRYVQPHQRDVTNLLAAAIQACHDEVPPDAVEPLFRQIVNQFVHDRSRPEAITIGLNAVREICLRMPLLMNEDLLQDLVLYKKSHEKAVSIAARSLITLFREICPSLLVKKDRGRPIDPKARPKAFGEVSVATDVPGIELLHHENDLYTSSSEDDMDEEDAVDEEAASTGDNGEEGNASDENDDLDDGVELDESDEGSEREDLADEEIDEGLKAQQISADEQDEDNDHDSGDDGEDRDAEEVGDEPRKKKRKLEDHLRNLNPADLSLRALRRLAAMTFAKPSNDGVDGILSNEDFQRINELKARKEAKQALSQHGLLRKDSCSTSATFRIPSSEQLRTKRLDPAKLEAHIRSKLSKDERLALVRAGREDRGQYQARAAVKQKKTGGLSNRQKQHKKVMPLAAKKHRAARSRQEKKQQRKRNRKQFKGRKAWK